MSRIVSNLLYAACNLKDMGDTRIDGIIHFDARPGNPLTVTGDIIGMSNGDHHMSIEQTCDAGATGGQDLGVISNGSDGTASFHIYDVAGNLDSEGSDQNVEGKSISLHGVRVDGKPAQVVACCKISHQQAR